MVKVLTKHPDIACTNESDIGWILYQIHLGRGFKIENHPLDTPYSMWLTSGLYHNEIWPCLFGGETDLQKIFYNVTCKAAKRKEAKLAGDKKPCQYADPPVNRFLASFENVRFIHMVRHPAQCVGSMSRLASENRIGPRYMYSIEQACTTWGLVESWVEEAKGRAPTISIRYEDLLDYPQHEIGRLGEFLGVSGLTSPSIKKPQRYDVDIEPFRTDQVLEAMERHGYE